MIDRAATPSSSPSAAPAPSQRMTSVERRATAGLAGIAGLRMLGMFIVLPVFALFAQALPGGSDRTLVGLALGAYGLTQALLQMPFGWASDRLGRKPVLYAGLALFAAGSFLSAWAPTIAWMIVGRALQGAGAVSAIVIALASDLTREDVRTRAMGTIGITIGATFTLSLVAGPLLLDDLGVPGLFAATGVLALVAMLVVRVVIPDPPPRATTPVSARPRLRRVLADPQLARLNYGIFALHAVLMALFIQIPFALRDAGVPADAQWRVYLPVMLFAVAVFFPLSRQADRPRRGKPLFIGAVLLLLVAEIALAAGHASLVVLVPALVLFFIAFNLLEAMLPSLVSRYAPEEGKGSAIGVYSSLQFAGAFAGAAAGGWLAQHAGGPSVFILSAALTALWLLFSVTMRAPPRRYANPYSLGET